MVVRVNRKSDKFTHRGVEYHNVFELSEQRAVVTVDDSKSLLDGKFSITSTKGSYKYGDELQFKIFAPKGSGITKNERNNSPWERIEIMIPMSELDNIIQALQKTKEELKDE